MGLIQFVNDSAPYLSAENLNNNFNYLAEKNIITATFTSNHTITTTGTEIVNLNSSTSVGTKLTLTNDGGILIGSEISKVKISANANFQTVTAGEKTVEINKNNTGGVAANITNISGRTTLSISPIIINVIPGDILYLKLGGAVNDTIRRNMTYSNMTVEVVE